MLLGAKLEYRGSNMVMMENIENEDFTYDYRMLNQIKMILKYISAQNLLKTPFLKSTQNFKANIVHDLKKKYYPSERKMTFWQLQ